MLVSEPEDGDALCFYPDCRGTASFARMILERRRDPQVQRDIRALREDDQMRERMKISLYIWLLRLLGQDEEAEVISRISEALPLPRRDFERYCLAYFLLTMRTEGLDEYIESAPDVANSEI